MPVAVVAALGDGVGQGAGDDLEGHGAAEPLVGVALGIGVLGDHLAASSTDVVIEVLCVVGMLAGVFLIGRSPVLATAGAVAS